MIKAVLFDMDGLMLDTESLGTIAWIKAGEALNYPITEDIVDLLRGRVTEDGRKVFEDKFGSKEVYDQVKPYKNEYMKELVLAYGISVKEGLFILLKYLKEKEIKTAVATSTSKNVAKQYLKQAKVDSYFDAFVYGDMVEKGKPNPECFLKAAALLDTSPSECMVLEDSYAGICAAYSGGMMPIFVPDMMAANDEIRCKASMICGTLADIVPLLEAENKKEG